MDQEFVAIKIEDRSMACGDFIVAMTPEQKRRCGILGFWIFGNHCVVSHQPLRRDAAAHSNATSLGERALKVPARVVTTNEDLARTAPADSNLEAVRVDLSLRAALGINTTGSDMGTQSVVRIFPLELGPWTTLKEFTSRVLGRRYQILRVTRGFLPDLEANIARAREETLCTLGCDLTGAAIAQTIIEKPAEARTGPGRRLMRYLFKLNLNAQAYRLNSVPIKILPFDKIEFDKRLKEEEHPDTDIFIAPTSYFAVDKDLPRLALNEEMRRAMRVSTFEPVLIRRDMWRALLTESVNFGVLTLLSTLAIPQLAEGGVAKLTAAISAGLLVALLVVFRIRSAVK